MADKLVSQDPTKPGIAKVNGPTLTAANQIPLVSLDTTGAVNTNVMTMVAGSWAPAAAGASADTASNLGAGSGVFASKVGADFQFKSLVAGANITITPAATEITIASTAVASLGSIVIIEHREISGTAGGTSTSGSWQTHPLTTEVSDPDGIATLAANQIVLTAGTYRVWGWSQAFNSTFSKNRIQNVTAGTTLVFGESLNNATENTNHFMGRFTVAGAQSLELQYRVAVTQATNGLGNFTGFDTEIYAGLLFIKE